MLLCCGVLHRTHFNRALGAFVHTTGVLRHHHTPYYFPSMLQGGGCLISHNKGVSNTQHCKHAPFSAQNTSDGLSLQTCKLQICPSNGYALLIFGATLFDGLKQLSQPLHPLGNLFLLHTNAASRYLLAASSSELPCINNRSHGP